MIGNFTIKRHVSKSKFQNPNSKSQKKGFQNPTPYYSINRLFLTKLNHKAHYQSTDYAYSNYQQINVSILDKEIG